MGSDGEGSLKKEKKEKKDKDKDKDKDKKHKDEGKDKEKKHKDEKKDKGKDKDKDEKKDKKDKVKDEKGDKDKKDKDKEKKDKDKDKEKKSKDEDKKDKDKKEKKDKDKDKKDKPSHPPGIPSGPAHGGEAASYFNLSGAPSQPPQPTNLPQSGEAHWFLREPGAEVHAPHPPPTMPAFPDSNLHYTSQPPPMPQPPRAVGDAGGVPPLQKAPPSGYRIPLDPNAQFPAPDLLGRPPATDFDGSTPVFVGSAIFPDSVQPCKIIPSLHPPCRVSSGGTELEYHGRFDLLPVTPDMEWVPTSRGQIPPGRRPIEGGYESSGGKLYHALGSIQGVYVPGKAGEHLVSRPNLSLLRRGLTIVETF
jgi:hypothetical protein